MPTSTRSQSGVTPRQVTRPGYVETPTRRTRRQPDSPTDTKSRKRDSLAQKTAISESPESDANGHAKNNANGHANGVKGKNAPQGDNVLAAAIKGEAVVDPRVDDSGHFEFGGAWGVSAMMVCFPLLMYYLWIGATFYDGHLPRPVDDESLGAFLRHLGVLVYEEAFPGLKAWVIYWTFIVFEAACYLYLPGVQVKGKPLPHEGGRQLAYYCSAVWSLWVTIALLGALHLSGLFKLYTVLDEFGPLMSVAIISSYLVSVAAYASALYRGAEHRMSGSPAYDFFMGAELNPRMFGLLDFKMFFEVRIPWYILLTLSLGTAARQYEQFGWISGEVMFLVMAHFLYANACSKGEECIVTTWDMYYEKWGFMLIFWNLAGVPLSYCHCTLYLANHAPSVYHWHPMVLTLLYASYLFVYWVWDTCNSQKNNFRQQERGAFTRRKAFPQLPWQTLKDPKIIKTSTGDSILVDGWYQYARKINYTGDLFFALSWGFVTGFNSPFPWFYPLFFSCMISHRALRDIQKCQQKYGEAWEEYTRRVPYLFIPYVI